MCSRSKLLIGYSAVGLIFGGYSALKRVAVEFTGGVKFFGPATGTGDGVQAESVRVTGLTESFLLGQASL